MKSKNVENIQDKFGRIFSHLHELPSVIGIPRRTIKAWWKGKESQGMVLQTYLWVQIQSILFSQ